ncbi:MAG: SDR family NAD(P)-dependent oxidoreductase, partial [Bacteroidia bacterium]|nr:SDR family NAD(P)-dependent oxidoreductase [Bacteroidia bacterium]
MKDKVVIITGASSGIGQACAMKFAKEGAIVVLAARNIEKLNDIVDDIKIGKGQALAVQTDVSKEEDCQKLMDTTIEYFNQIDVLINNAGISMRSIFADTEIAVIKKLMDINFWGTVHCTKIALPHLLKMQGSVVGV